MLLQRLSDNLTLCLGLGFLAGVVLTLAVAGPITPPNDVPLAPLAAATL